MGAGEGEASAEPWPAERVPWLRAASPPFAQRELRPPARRRATAKSAGVLRFCNCSSSAASTRMRRARSRTDSRCNERRPAVNCASTFGSTTGDSTNGNPTVPFTEANTAFASTARIRCVSSAVRNGISQPRNKIFSVPFARARRSAVATPPSGPWPGVSSCVCTRQGKPNSADSARAWPSSVRRPSRNSALARPMRVLPPPARMTHSHSLKLMTDFFFKKLLPLLGRLLVCPPFSVGLPLVNRGKTTA